MRRTTTLALLVATLTVLLAAPGSAASAAGPATEDRAAPRADLADEVRITLPGSVRRDRLTNVRLTLPTSVAAIDGRLLVAPRAAVLMGVATYGSGTALRPVAIDGGFAFGAYGLRPRSGWLIVDLVLLPKRDGRLELEVLIDSASGAAGGRIGLKGTHATGVVGVGRSPRRHPAPAAADAPAPTRAAGPLTDALADGRIDRRDLDITRAAWEEARALERTCGRRTPGDRNGDGCTDSVDLQAVLVGRGTRIGGPRPPVTRADDDVTRRQVVTSTADTPDAAPGDGVCADSQDRCTLRAAIMEAEYLAGDDRITFDLPGSAPVTIQLTGRLPLITSRTGNLVINGYTQTGARVNDAASGSNAVMGVVVRGNGSAAREYGAYITGPDNIIRGIAFTNLYRGVMLDGSNAARNRIVGNWFGFDGNGNSQSQGNFGIVINVGARDNVIGGPDRADRNVMGQWRTPVDFYGTGVRGNVVQGNLLCIKPNGAPSFCYSGVDMNFGPKDNLVGGDGDGERNVIGPTTLQGIELSHGWDPKLPYGSDTATTWQINDNRVIGNWVGFRANGAYDAAFRSGSQPSTSDNGNGINVYDGTNRNLVARNHVASVYDGIQVMSSNSEANVVRGNVIGESPLGENAPLSGWGIVVRWGTRYNQVLSNTIRNAGKGGVGLLNVTNYGSPVAVAYNTRISRTIVTGTAGPAIHLATTPDDPDQTANDTVRPPVITSAALTEVSGTSAPGATVEVYRANRAEGARGLPVEFLGDAQADGDGGWRLSVSGLSDGDRVTALQIRVDENTSELAPNAVVGDAPPPPPPGPGELLAADSFGRTEAAGWGTAETGGAWALGTGAYSVEGGVGRMIVGAGQTREARLAVAAADVVVTGELAFDRVPAGGNAFAYVLARATATRGIRGTIRVAANGVVFAQLKRVVDRAEANVGPEVNTGLVATAGGAIRFRLRVVGDELRLRVWQGADEPSGWTTTATDGTVSAAGDAGLMGYAGRQVSNGPIAITLDAFEVRRG